MPTSKKQRKFACAVASGKARGKRTSMSKKTAKEMCKAKVKKKQMGGPVHKGASKGPEGGPSAPTAPKPITIRDIVPRKETRAKQKLRTIGDLIEEIDLFTDPFVQYRAVSKKQVARRPYDATDSADRNANPPREAFPPVKAKRRQSIRRVVQNYGDLTPEERLEFGPATQSVGEAGRGAIAHTASKTAAKLARNAAVGDNPNLHDMHRFGRLTKEQKEKSERAAERALHYQKLAKAAKKSEKVRALLRDYPKKNDG